MQSHRRRNLIASRRRLEDEEEDEDDAAEDQGNDTQSEGSIGSDAEDGDADDSDPDNERRIEMPNSMSKEANHDQSTRKTDEAGPERSVPAPTTSIIGFAGTADTNAMRSGLKPSATADGEDALEFEQSGPVVEEAKLSSVPAPSNKAPAVDGKHENAVERRKRDHEEYKKQRDSNPAFVPNRGGFFMHDQRFAPGMNSVGPFGRGRGRGRLEPLTLHANASTANGLVETMDGTWMHDLHDAINDTKPESANARNVRGTNFLNNIDPQKSLPNVHSGLPPRTNPFSKTSQMGTVQLKVYIPEMKEPRIFAGVPVKQHTRLPDLRPPLRRDKPVRISLPNQPPRYNFPKVERSFVFIPRAERPNQQGGRRSRPKGLFSQHGSRRTSVQGGSVYTPSISMSRRSSRAHSPAGSISSRPMAAPIAMGPPIVRLPMAPMQSEPPVISPQPGDLPSGTATYLDMQQRQQAYPLPQDPAYQGNRNSNIPMHQPRPQKTVSVAGIESPTELPFRVPQQQEQQPFHHQVPAHMNGRPQSQEQIMYYPHSRQVSFPSQGSGGTPLSNIPERAIHAQPFQPSMMPQQQGFYPQMYPIQNMYYYATPSGQQGVYSNGAMAGAPMYMQQPQQMSYMVPMLTAAAPGDDNGSAPPGTLGHDGTTYFFDPTQVNGVVEGLAPASYAVPGIGGMMTPSPDGFFYSQSHPQSTSYTSQEFVPSR